MAKGKEKRKGMDELMNESINQTNKQQTNNQSIYE